LPRFQDGQLLGLRVLLALNSGKAFILLLKQRVKGRVQQLPGRSLRRAGPLGL